MKIATKTASAIFLLAILLIGFLYFSIQNALAASCTFDKTGTQSTGTPFTITHNGFAAGETIGIFDDFGGGLRQNIGTTADSLTSTKTVTGSISVGSGNYTVMIQTRYPIVNFPCGSFNIPPGSGGGGGVNPNLGKINPSQNIPSISGDPSTFVAGAIRSGISLLLVVAFVVDLIWTIFAGFRFITASGDPKTVGAAWGQIYWGLIGMLVVLGSFAIIKMVEIFFNVNILSGGFILPQI